MYFLRRVQLINHDCLPILMLLYIMLYTMLAYLMLFAALSNAICLCNAYFFSIDLCKCFLFSCFDLDYIVYLFQVLFCILHSEFNLLVFQILCLCHFFHEKAMCSLEK